MMSNLCRDFCGAAGAEFSSADPELIVARLHEVFGDGVRFRAEAAGPDASFRHTCRGGGSFHLHRVDTHLTIEAEVNGLDWLYVGVPSWGSYRQWLAGPEEQISPSEVAIFPNGHPGGAATSGLGMLSLGLDPELFEEVVSDDPEIAWTAPDLATGRPNSARAAAFFRRTLDYVDNVVLANPEAAGSPLLLGAGRLLASATMHAFGAIAEPTDQADLHEARPAAVRRAIAMIEASPADVSLVEVARAARITPRALQLAFRRHLGMTPNSYLRKVRLDRAREELRHPGSQPVTVTAVAAKWGFGHAGRFSAYYQAEYGETPSQTLERNRSV